MAKKKINTKKKVRFYDDRGREDTYTMSKILFETKNVCLCVSEDLKKAYEDIELDWERKEIGIILFDKNTREVLTNNLDCYYAENYA